MMSHKQVYVLGSLANSHYLLFYSWYLWNDKQFFVLPPVSVLTCPPEIPEKTPFPIMTHISPGIFYLLSPNRCHLLGVKGSRT